MGELVAAGARVDLQDPVLETVAFHGALVRGDAELLKVQRQEG